MKTRWQFWAALVLTIGAVAIAKAQYVVAKSSATSYCTLYGDIDQKMAYQVISCIEVANRAQIESPIVLYIDSGGGSVLDGGTIVDAMIASRRPIITVDVGYAASMAAYIWSYGAQRYMHPHALLMYHQATATIEGREDSLEARLILLRRMTAEYRAHLASLIGLAEQQKHQDQEWWLMPEDAVALHLADGILIEGDYPPPSE